VEDMPLEQNLWPPVGEEPAAARLNLEHDPDLRQIHPQALRRLRHALFSERCCRAGEF
jgi:hypothetical protein